MNDLEKKYLLKDGSINYATLRNEAEIYRELEFSFENFKADFPNGKAQTPIGEVNVSTFQFHKMEIKGRKDYLGLIKPTLENPNFIVDFEDTTCFFKVFKNENNIIKFVSVTKDRNNEMLDVVSNHNIKNHKLELLVRSGKLLYMKDGITRNPYDSRSSGIVTSNNEIARNPYDIKSSGIVTSDNEIIPQNSKNTKSNRFANLVKPDDLPSDNETDKSKEIDERDI